MDEDFLYVSEARNATEQALQKKTEQTIEELKQNPKYQEFAAIIREAADKGENVVSFYPNGNTDMEYIEFFDNKDTILPKDMKEFNPEDVEILNAFQTYGGFNVGISSVPVLYKDQKSMDNVQTITVRW